jgi:serine/threonine protein kinase
MFKCAIKFVKKEILKDHDQLKKLMESEISVLGRVSHPNILGIFELLHDERHYYIVSEYVRHGELYDFMVKKDTISEGQIKHIVRQLFMAINYLHCNGIVHRDIKPQNILVYNKDKLEIKLTDFGFAKICNEKTMSEMLGSPLYMPPEIINNETYNSKVDIWSAGVVVYILVSGKVPFYSEDRTELYNAIKKKEPSY